MYGLFKWNKNLSMNRLPQTQLVIVYFKIDPPLLKNPLQWAFWQNNHDNRFRGWGLAEFKRKAMFITLLHTGTINSLNKFLKDFYFLQQNFFKKNQISKITSWQLLLQQQLHLPSGMTVRVLASSVITVQLAAS